ncbi:MAG: zinc ribbon domain-containing protein [Methylotenera sp.]|nr:zinc ribbon domain-containing protein [Methylotenera sp.]
MALIKCKACGNEVSENAEKCPKCGEPTKKANSITLTNALGAIVIVIVAIWYFGGGGQEKHINNEMGKINNQVAIEMIEQYNIAKRQGDPIQKCIQAGIVSASFLQSKDEANYQVWKKTQDSDCKAAGMPQ